MEATKKEAIIAVDHFVEFDGVKYEHAVKNLTKDRDGVLTFYGFQTEHRTHIRSTNPIQRVLAIVGTRPARSKAA